MPHYVDRFRAAMAVLSGHGHIKQRLIKAFDQNLRDIDDVLLPVAVKESFAELRQMMTRVAPSNGEGPICASVRKMSIDEADVCANHLVDLYGDMIRYGDKVVEPPAPDDDAVEVPAMLLKSV